jgi:hypothetical protein
MARSNPQEALQAPRAADLLSRGLVAVKYTIFKITKTKNALYISFAVNRCNFRHCAA